MAWKIENCHKKPAKKKLRRKIKSMFSYLSRQNRQNRVKFISLQNITCFKHLLIQTQENILCKAYKHIFVLFSSTNISYFGELGFCE